MSEEALALRAIAYWSLLPLLGLPISIIASRNGSSFFIKRFIVWMLLVPLFLGAFYLGKHALILLLAIACLGGAWELAILHTSENSNGIYRTIAMVLLSLPWLALAYSAWYGFSLLALVAFMLPLAAMRPLGSSHPRWLPPALAIYLGAGIYFWALLAGETDNIRWLLLAYTVVTVNDMLSAVFGKLMKSFKPFPNLSPKKSLAGYLGGALCALGAGFILAPGFKDVPTIIFVSVMLVLIALGNMGDLFASWIKRGYGVKDFSRALGDMGGVLDRLDSLLPLGAALYLMLPILKAS